MRDQREYDRLRKEVAVLESGLRRVRRAFMPSEKDEAALVALHEVEKVRLTYALTLPDLRTL